LRVAIEETAKELRVQRCFIRLGARGESPTAQWQAEGVEAIHDRDQLAVSNLAVKNRKTVAIGDVETAPELEDQSIGRRERLLAIGTRAALAVPIIVFDELIGVLALHRTTPRPWTDDEIVLTEAVAHEIGLSVRVAQLLRENELRLLQQKTFFRIAAVLGESLSLSDTLDTLARAAHEAFDSAFAAVLIPRGATMELAAGAELPLKLAEALEEGLPESADCLRAAADDGHVLASPDVTRDDRFEQPWQALAREAGYGALLAVPAASPRAERSALVVVFFAGEREFTDDDLELARQLGDAATSALERSELFEAERTTRALSQQLARTGGALATELDPAAVLEEVVQQAPALLGADACAVRTLEEDELVVSAASGAGAEEAIGTRAAATAGLSGDVFQSRLSRVVADARTRMPVDEVSIGDYVLAGGEAAVAVIVEAVCRLLPGVLGNEQSHSDDSFGGTGGAMSGLLEGPVYTRPRTWREREVPDVLLSGNHRAIARWQRDEALRRTAANRPDLIRRLAAIPDGLDKRDLQVLADAGFPVDAENMAH